MGERQLAVRNLHFGVCFTSKLANGLDYFGHAASIGWVIVAEPAAISVEREFAAAGE